MITLNEDFSGVMEPVKALLIYQSLEDQPQTRVEAYDIDESGSPINAHPLSIEECISFARSLAASDELSSGFLQSKGILPDFVLYTSLGLDGFAVWYTRPQSKTLNFLDSLDIPSGGVNIPAMIWKAGKTELQVFSVKLKENEKPGLDTPLYHAPFFNIYSSGKVCMGTVKVDFKKESFLEDFIQQWEYYFFSSFFSHTMAGHLPVKTNIIQLWQNLIEHQNIFPNDVLIKTGRTLKSLLK